MGCFSSKEFGNDSKERGEMGNSSNTNSGQVGNSTKKVGKNSKVTTRTFNFSDGQWNGEHRPAEGSQPDMLLKMMMRGMPDANNPTSTSTSSETNGQQISGVQIQQMQQQSQDLLKNMLQGTTGGNSSASPNENNIWMKSNVTSTTTRKKR
mmetsp:Transcript_31101/g.52229  ORF Transcript_31101/g.52229 Transcript_31101/m.52229 type:complete len:151 (-) Transcript_31101:126-578(-)